jgi:hypothetical protein
MAVQASAGLLRPGLYRDVEWIRATWFGNDGVTLLVATPVLVLALLRLPAGSERARLLWYGALGYEVYNYAFYMLGAALNALFPLYVAAFVVSAVALVLALAGGDAQATAAAFSPRTRVRVIGGFLVFVAVGLTAVWLGTWAAHVFAGRPTPVEPEAFRLVATLDLALMVPALSAGGVLLWRRRPWGYVIASIAAIQGALYLLVLTVNAGIAVSRGLVEAPGEIPVWGPLLLGTGIAAGSLLARASGRPAAD